MIKKVNLTYPMEPFIPFLFFLAALVLLTRQLSVFFHELGHAIPALVLTKEKVTIYIGSFGDPNKSLKIPIVPLTIFFR